MSFRCEGCKKPQPKHTKPVRVVVETRSKSYPARYTGVGWERHQIDAGGVGNEIVREEILCSKCAGRR